MKMGLLEGSPSGGLTWRHQLPRAQILNAFATGPSVPATMGKTEATNHHLLERSVRERKFEVVAENSRWIKLFMSYGLRRATGTMSGDVAIDSFEFIRPSTWRGFDFLHFFLAQRRNHDQWRKRRFVKEGIICVCERGACDDRHVD